MQTDSRFINHRLSRTALVLLFAFCLGAHAWAERHERTVDAWRPTNYDVTLAFDDKLTELREARTLVSITVLQEKVETIELDFGELPIDGVTVNGKDVRYERRPGMLVVSLNEPAMKGAQLKLAVAYHGRPKDGLVLAADKDGRPSATGDNWPNRVHHWIPCLDHPSAKATVSFQVNVRGGYLVVANGQFLGVSNNTRASGEHLWRYRESVPIPPYCMVISVTQGALLEPKLLSPTPLSYYVPQSDSRFAMQGFAPAAPVLRLFSQQVAPYPYEKLALIVGATRFGGMENSSAIVFPSTLFEPRKDAPLSRRFQIRQGLEEVIAHEIAHQWFGDSVTERTWSDLWLSEGFATYFAGLFLEREEGEPVFRAYMRKAAEEYFSYEQQRRTPIFDPETEDLFKLLNANNYQKGAWVLHMLRKRLGDRAFFAGIRAYYTAHKNGTATTEDLRAALERASGQSLKEFFARWVYRAGHPRYELNWSWNRKGTLGGGTLTMTLRQTQPDDPFSDPLPVMILSPLGTDHVIFTEGGGSISIPLKQRPTEIRPDPDETLLKEITVRPLE